VTGGWSGSTVVVRVGVAAGRGVGVRDTTAVTEGGGVGVRLTTAVGVGDRTSVGVGPVLVPTVKVASVVAAGAGPRTLMR
jgi:hypothetical protein